MVTKPRIDCCLQLSWLGVHARLLATLALASLSVAATVWIMPEGT